MDFMYEKRVLFSWMVQILPGVILNLLSHGVKVNLCTKKALTGLRKPILQKIAFVEEKTRLKTRFLSKYAVLAWQTHACTKLMTLGTPRKRARMCCCYYDTLLAVYD